VYVRPKSIKEIGVVGRVVDIPALRDGQKDRISIQQTNGKIQQLRPSRLVPIYDNQSKSQTMMILTPDTTNYRQLAVAHLRMHDKVLEVGCSTGMCTALVLRRMLLLSAMKNDVVTTITSTTGCLTDDLVKANIVAFDTGSDMVQQTQQALRAEYINMTSHLPGLSIIQSSVHNIDAFVDPTRAFSLATQNDKYPNVVLIDIGGNRELEGVAKMIHWIQSTFVKYPPRVMIVKSKELVQHLNDDSFGVTENAQSRLMEYLKTNNLLHSSLKLPPCYSHPLQAPLVLSPKDNETPICRFYNYHIDGCKRYSMGNECPFDHDYCHWCRQKGHVAIKCPGSL
jgi:precorrin-6B methylase 2